MVGNNLFHSAFAFGLALTLCIVSPATTQAQGARMLHAGISANLYEKENSLDPILCPGNEFNKDVATALLKVPAGRFHIWRRIPDWQVGRWEYSQSTTTRVVKYEGGRPAYEEKEHLGNYRSKSTYTIGLEKDRYGGIWDPYSSGYWTTTEYDRTIGYSYIKYSEPGSGEYPEFYAEMVSFSVDKQTNKINRVDQTRTWTRYAFIGPGLLKQENIHTFYNAQGEPESSLWTTRISIRTETFEQYEGRVADDRVRHKDFIAYLKDNGMEGLIPSESRLSLQRPSMLSNFCDSLMRTK